MFLRQYSSARPYQLGIPATWVVRLVQLHMSPGLDLHSLRFPRVSNQTAPDMSHNFQRLILNKGICQGYSVFEGFQESSKLFELMLGLEWYECARTVTRPKVP